MFFPHARNVYPEKVLALKYLVLINYGKQALREKCPNTEFFLVRIFPHADWIRRDTSYSVRMRENTDQKKLRIWTHFTKWKVHRSHYFSWFLKKKMQPKVNEFNINKFKKTLHFLTQYSIFILSNHFLPRAYPSFKYSFSLVFYFPFSECFS